MKYNDLVAVREQLDIIRGVTERGLSHAISFDNPDDGFVDLFQHILDEVAVTKALLEE
jgi:hypothetical protein